MKSQLLEYYQGQIHKIGNIKTDYPATIKIKSTAGQTHWMSLNDESASIIIQLLTENFTNPK